MRRTVDEGFRDFFKKLTPSSDESDAAKLHRVSIEQCIKSNFILQRFWRTGSFGNGTSISDYSDVDYMASITGANLSRNSSSLLTRLRSILKTRFPNTGVQTSCPAVVVPFGTDAKETTEVTPAYYVRTMKRCKIYGIPDCAGGWLASSPDAHNKYVRLVDSMQSSKVKPLIRFIKAWKYLQNVPISSFYLELRVAKYASKENSICYSVDVKRIFALLGNIDLAPIRDPMGISGDIPPCKSGADLLKAKLKVSDALVWATRACEEERRDNIKGAFDWWDRLFNYNFPNYYRFPIYYR